MAVTYSRYKFVTVSLPKRFRNGGVPTAHNLEPLAVGASAAMRPYYETLLPRWFAHVEVQGRKGFGSYRKEPRSPRPPQCPYGYYKQPATATARPLCVKYLVKLENVPTEDGSWSQKHTGQWAK
jgi:hypothetical protein